jgi:hypothetical protein
MPSPGIRLIPLITHPLTILVEARALCLSLASPFGVYVHRHFCLPYMRVLTGSTVSRHVSGISNCAMSDRSEIRALNRRRPRIYRIITFPSMRRSTESLNRFAINYTVKPLEPECNVKSHVSRKLKPQDTSTKVE